MHPRGQQRSGRFRKRSARWQASIESRWSEYTWLHRQFLLACGYILRQLLRRALHPPDLGLHLGQAGRHAVS